MQTRLDASDLSSFVLVWADAFEEGLHDAAGANLHSSTTGRGRPKILLREPQWAQEVQCHPDEQ
eukprot:11031215-Alexandrium_andersonii.AAC.1